MQGVREGRSVCVCVCVCVCGESVSMGEISKGLWQVTMDTNI